jgi:hypothetical protein
MNRRSFLYAVGAGAPLILGATNKSGSANPVIGEGDHQFECIHDWGELPADIKYAWSLRGLARPYLHSSHGELGQREQ